MNTLLTPKELAALFGVSSKTLTRWSTMGLLKPQFTPGGHRRYRALDVQELKLKYLDGKNHQ